MAHFAQLDENNLVLQVIVINNADLLNEDGIEKEEIGINFCKQLLGQNSNWVQTSYNGQFRKNYAGPGFYYDSQKDAFIPPKPYDDWVLNETLFQWDPPVPYPSDGKLYNWDQNNKLWLEC